MSNFIFGGFGEVGWRRCYYYYYYYKAPENTLKIGHKLGEGAFGEVRSAVDADGFERAVKIVCRKNTDEKSFENEMNILKMLSHENIVKYFGWGKDEKNFYLVMELMEISIKGIIDKSTISNGVAAKHSRDILQGLIYLHSKNVVHRDIKCANILLDKSGVAKLADMGLSKLHLEATRQVQSRYLAGTLFWMSPEVLEGQEAGRRSDVWSFGCTVFEMVVGTPPYHDQIDPVTKITELDHDDLIYTHEYLSPQLQEFLMRIFVEFQYRPLAYQLEEDPWLQLN